MPPRARALDDLHDHVIVCGLHEVGLRVVEQLRGAGEQVVTVDPAPAKAMLRASETLGARHVNADGRRESSLEAAGIENSAALVCVADDDLTNLEVALLARRIRPDMRVVVQLRNQSVGRAVGEVTGAGSVLDVAAIAAPTLAESCLDQHTRALDIGGEPFVLQEFTAGRPGTLRELVGDLAPVAVVAADGSPMHVCPGRDLAVHQGDRVFVIGDSDDAALARVAGTLDETVGARRADRGLLAWAGQARRYARGFITESQRPLRVTLAALFTVAVVSVGLLQLGYRENGRHMSVLDSAYFTTETLTTVGFGDFYFGDQTTWLRVWAIVLMIIGATLVTVLYALLTNLLVSRRIAQSLGRQVATQMRDHVILVGLGAVGLGVLENLVAARRPVVVLERDEDNRFLARARELNVPVVFGDSTVPANLDAAGLPRARSVAVLTSSDLANIETGLAVYDLLGQRRGRVPVVMRVFDRSLAATLETTFGFHHVRSTAALAAPWFVGAALGLDIHTTFYVDRQPMLIARLTVAGSGGLAGSTMAELSARIRVIAIRRHAAAALEYPPRRDTRFVGGDQAYLVGPYEELLRVLRRDAGHSDTGHSDAGHSIA